MYLDKLVFRRIGCLLTVLALLLVAMPVRGAVRQEGEFGSNRYTQPLSDDVRPAGYDLEGYRLLLENDTLGVYWREAVGGLRVLDKRSGYVWGSVAQDKPENLNGKWSAIANSLVIAEVFDSTGKSTTLTSAAPALQCSVADGVIRMQARWEEYGLSFAFRITLEDARLTFQMEDDDLHEEGEYLLGSVTFAPFLGAVSGNSIPGYVFIPDGCGALIRFLSPRNYLRGYEKRIYGEDLGIDAINSAYTGAANTATDEQPATLPLYGIVHGEGCGAFLAVATGGEEYGVIVAEPAGLICDYTRANIRFVYRQMYEQPVSRVGVGVQMLQPQRNTVNPKLTYTFLDGEDAGYAGMARTYRQMLWQADALRPWQATGPVPLRVDFLAADIEKQFLWTRTKMATSLDQLESAGMELKNGGVTGLKMGLVGWQKGCMNGYKKTASVKQTVFGSWEKLNGLPDLLVALSPFAATEKQFNRRSEGGISLSQTLTVRRDPTGDWLGDTYYIKPETALAALQSHVSALCGVGRTELLIRDMELLYGEYLTGKETTRSQAKTLLEQTLQSVAQSGANLTLTKPNAFLFSVIQGYDQILMVNSQFQFETDTVPFLQMVLSGSAELYAPYTNLNFYAVSDRLKMIDYNVCPTYLLTGCDNYALRDTASSGLCSTYYADWYDHILEAYSQMEAVLCHTRGQVMLDRETPQTGVSINYYENGTVYVNYNASARTVNGIQIPAQSAVWQEGGR